MRLIPRNLFPGALLAGLAASPVAAQSAPKTAAIALDFRSLSPRRDSFAVIVQNVPLGWMRAVVERTAKGFTYTEDTEIGSLIEQHTVVEMGPSGEIRSVRQQGKVQGEPTTIALDYQGSRVKGSASTISPQGAKSVTIDTTIAAGTIDDNVLYALLSILDMKPGATWTFPVFSGSAGETMQMSLRVAGTDTVALGSGPVPAYRLELSGGPQPATFFVSTATPRRLLKIAPAGAPVEILRVP
ncbi:MAG: hypothetical protein ABI647_07735 [Gemmatimonadota bacterium]